MKEIQDDIQNEIELIFFSVIWNILNIFNQIQWPQVDKPLVASNISTKISCVSAMTLLFTITGLNYDCDYLLVLSLW